MPSPLKNQLLLRCADPLERLAICLLIHASPGVRGPFRPALGDWIKDLGTTSDSASAVTISRRRIRSHTPPLGMKNTPCRRNA
jgi:hypothetical protein